MCSHSPYPNSVLIANAMNNIPDFSISVMRGFLTQRCIYTLKWYFHLFWFNPWFCTVTQIIVETQVQDHKSVSLVINEIKIILDQNNFSDTIHNIIKNWIGEWKEFIHLLNQKLSF